MSDPVFLVAVLPAAGETVLDGPEGRHAATVRRLAVGERLVLTDGAGGMASCVVTDVGRDRLALDVGELRHVPRPSPRVTVVQALPKGDRGELAVEVMTEAGVDAIVPWQAARCVTRWRDGRGAKGLSRWRTAAREAAKQSRRVWLPEITEPATTGAVVSRLTEAAASLVLHQASDRPLATARLPPNGDIVLVVGPEGGVTDEEIDAFVAAGATTVRLGDTVLRTSTAGVAALSAVNALTARWR